MATPTTLTTPDMTVLHDLQFMVILLMHTAVQAHGRASVVPVPRGEIKSNPWRVL